MEEFCAGPESRAGLIQKIKTHFDYIYAHEELYKEATRFHKELATFSQSTQSSQQIGTRISKTNAGLRPLLKKKTLRYGKLQAARFSRYTVASPAMAQL